MTKFQRLEMVIASGFFLGYIPVAPATAACSLGVLIWYFLIPYKIAYCTVAVGLFVVGVAISSDLSKIWGKDPRRIVIDEYACLMLPLFITAQKIIPLLMTFVVFRLFDIIKPPPLKELEKLPGGWGIMLDDLGAAIYTMIIIAVVQALVKF